MRAVPLTLSALAVVMVLLAVPAVARHEQTLRDSDTAQERAVMYELLSGRTLRIPIDAGTDVARLVARGFGKQRPSDRGSATLRVTLQGPQTSRTEEMKLTLTTHDQGIPSEDGEVMVGDRTTLNIDTADVGPGVLAVTLDELSGAEGLLVRSYLRSPLDDAQAQARRNQLGAHGREHLARRAGELDWADLAPETRAALLRTRWSKIAALPDAVGPLVSRVLSSPAPTASRPATRQAQPEPEHAEVPESEQASPRAAVDAIHLTPERELLIEADETPLVLRLRAALPDTEQAREPVRLRVVIGASGSASQVFAVSGPRAHVLVPPHARASITADGDAAEVALFELDPQAPPRPLRGSENASAEPWRGFVPRKPSNFAMFEANAKGQLWLDEASSAAPVRQRLDPTLPRARVARPRSYATLKHGEQLYVEGRAQLSVDVPSSGTVLALRLFSSAEAEVTVLIDGEAPRRRLLGVPRFITTARRLRFRGEAAFGLVLGDDLAAGRHVVSLRYPAGVKLWLHAPWQGHSHRPEPSAWLSAEAEP